MSNVGCKIYSSIREQDRVSNIKNAIGPDFPLEIGFYNRDGVFGFTEEFLKILTVDFANYKRKIVHLSIKNTLFSYDKDIENWLMELKSEIDVAKGINALYVILHDSKWRSSVRKRGEFIKIMAKNSKILKDYFDIPIYLENTFEGIDFYKELFEQIDGNLNFCFDIGHTRVWSDDSYQEWYDFLLLLRKSGLKLHFHIHTNDYIFDEHLSFTQREDRESVDFIKGLILEFPTSNFILEIQRDFRENVELFNQIKGG